MPLSKGKKPKDDIVKHIATEVRGVPAETSSGDSVIDSGEIKAKAVNKKVQWV